MNFVKIPGKTNQDGIALILDLWDELLSILSDVDTTASIERFEKSHVLEEGEIEYVSWPDLIQRIAGFNNKLNSCLDNNAAPIVYEHSERLFSLSVDRDLVVSSYKNLTRDLKNTKKGTKRYGNLDTVITGLFNATNLLIGRTDKVLESNCCEENKV